MLEFIEWLTAFGVGSIFSVAVQTYLTQRAATKQRNFQEKKEAYVGVLDSFRILFSKDSIENQRNVAY